LRRALAVLIALFPNSEAGGFSKNGRTDSGIGCFVH
jgi:hypothetical protein